MTTEVRLRIRPLPGPLSFIKLERRVAKLYGWKCQFCGDYVGFFREDDEGSLFGNSTKPLQCACGSTEFKKEDLTNVGDS